MWLRKGDEEVGRPLCRHVSCTSTHLHAHVRASVGMQAHAPGLMGKRACRCEHAELRTHHALHDQSASAAMTTCHR